MERPLQFTQREHFLVDPVFAQCWGLMEKERLLPPGEKVETKGTIAEEDDNPIVELPWNWNKLGRMLEYIRNIIPDDKSTEVENLKISYKILLDVQHYLPTHLSIVVTDRTIVVRGKHEEIEDPDGAVSREFCRKYILPADALMDAIDCNLSSDGVLYISAPRDLPTDKSPRRLSLKDSIKSTFSSFINWTGPHVIEGKVFNSPREGGGESRPISDEPIHSWFQGLSDFDRIPFWSRQSLENSQFGIKSNGDMFKALIDVRQYTPEELTLYKTPRDIFVEGTHEDLPDKHGIIQHYFHFTRKYTLPVGVKNIRSRWTWNGALEITAHKSDLQENEKLTLVPILVSEYPTSEHKKTEQIPLEDEMEVKEEKKTTKIPTVYVTKIELPLIEDKKIEQPVKEETKTEIPVVNVKKIEFTMGNKIEMRKIGHSPIIETKTDNQLPMSADLDDKEVQKLPASGELKTGIEGEIRPTRRLSTDEQLPLSEDLEEVMGDKFVRQLTVSEIVNTQMKYWMEDEEPPAYEDIEPDKTDDTTAGDKETLSSERHPIAPGF